MNSIHIADLADRVVSGDRVAIGRALTLVESSRQEDRVASAELLSTCTPRAGHALRVGITGAPGVGKSTLIEALGMKLIREGRRIAVVAVDPTSVITRGSILGDKTRMQQLAAEENAFIRPSPSGGTPGGTALRTRETMVVLEAAGYDTLFVETVGVGQTETTVHTMVDFFLLLALAGAGDELQGIKRGIVELADAVAITKADGENRAAAQRARIQLKNALDLFPPQPSGWKPLVHVCSALTGEGLDRLWQTVLDHEKHARASGYFAQRRTEQARHWFHQTLEQGLRDSFYGDPRIGRRMRELEQVVVAGDKSAAEAAEDLLAMWRERER